MCTKRTKQRHSFLLLPFEVRQIIYSHLFANATTTIHNIAPYYYLLLYTDKQIRNYTGPERFDQCAYLSLSQRCHSALMYANKQVHVEARLALMQSWHLRFAAYPFEAAQSLPAMRAHMASIKHVTIGQRDNNVPDIERSLFPGLELLEIDVAIRKSRSTDKLCRCPSSYDYCDVCCDGPRSHGYEVEFLDCKTGIRAASVFPTTPDSVMISKWKNHQEMLVAGRTHQSAVSLRSQILRPDRGYRILFTIENEADFFQYDRNTGTRQKMGRYSVWLKFDVDTLEIVCRRILPYHHLSTGSSSSWDKFEHIYVQGVLFGSSHSSCRDC